MIFAAVFDPLAVGMIRTSDPTVTSEEVAVSLPFMNLVSLLIVKVLESPFGFETVIDVSEMAVTFPPGA
jgi:hypothetical protein